MTQHTKRITLLLFIGTLVSLILLSASLSNMQLRAGSPFPDSGKSDEEFQFYIGPTPLQSHPFIILQGIFALIFLMLMIYVPARLIALITIKKIAQLLFILLVSLVMVIAISYIPFDLPAGLPDDSFGISNYLPANSPGSPLGKPPQGLVLVVLIIFLLGVGLLIFKTLKLWLRPTRVKEQLLHEAETAVVAIKAGGDFRNVILHCYLQMTNILREEQKIVRRYNMTAREFEDWLESKGYPTVPVHRLTRLFEKVRYGTMPTMKEDEKTAVESLNEFIRFCRGERD